MPLLDRLRLLGMLDDSDGERQAESTPQKDARTQSAAHKAVVGVSGEDQKPDESEESGASGQSEDSSEVGEAGRASKSKIKKSLLTHSWDSGLGESGHDDSNSNDSACGSDIDDDNDDDGDTDYYASSESDLAPRGNGSVTKANMRRQSLGKHDGTLVLLGTAEAQRQRSKRAGAPPAKLPTKRTSPSQQGTNMHLSAAGGRLTDVTAPPGEFVPVKHPTGDIDAGDGFHVCGFRDGKRVYLLDSPHIARLQSLVVKTAVGYCYLDTESMLPPKVVSVPAEPAPLETSQSGVRTPPLANLSGADLSAASITEPLSTTTQPALIVNGCFAIRPSALGGLGAFALRDLLRGEHILVEEPLLRTTLFHMPGELDKLPPAKRAQFDALTGHHPDPNASTAEKIWTANTFMTGSMDAVFALASRFNHACTPRDNIGYYFDRNKNVLIMTAIKKIPAGTELVITYGKSPSMLFQRFGFRCTCGACSGFDEDAAQQYQDSNWSQV